MSNSVGIGDVCGSLKRTYFSVFAIYSCYILSFTAIFYALGFTSLINTGTFVIDTITGGFQPTVSAYSQYLGIAPKICIIALMLLGSLNFAFSYNLFARKLRKALSFEIELFVLILLVGTISISLASNVGLLDSFFHVVSMSSSTGQSYIPLGAFGNTGYSILIVIMVIGGCAFSMAGGLRISRIISFAKSAKASLLGVLIRENAFYASKKNIENNESLENLSASVSISLFIIALVLFSVIFTTIGVSFTDALFEVGSALTTNGISMGITTVAMPVGYKWLMIVAMTVGRVEILSILLALFTIGRKPGSKLHFSLNLPKKEYESMDN